MSQDARLDEEQATARRARILGLNYIDVSTIIDKQLYKDMLTNEELERFRVVPLTVADHAITFGITTSTSQQTMQYLKQRFLDQQIQYAIISDTGYRDYIKLYNPPKKVVYTNIDITTADTDTLVQQVSATLEQVRADDMLAYLVSQAHRLGASDIHLEVQETYTRIRFRIDGVLHIIATMQPDKYRMLISAIASAGNVSTASVDAQQGHIAQKVTMADGSPVDVNLRLETAVAHAATIALRAGQSPAGAGPVPELDSLVGELSALDAALAELG